MEFLISLKEETSFKRLARKKEKIAVKIIGKEVHTIIPTSDSARSIEKLNKSVVNFSKRDDFEGFR